MTRAGSNCQNNLATLVCGLLAVHRDGEALAARIRAAVPLPSAQRRRLVDGFVVVIRATVKGSLVVALVQGALGGLMFWFPGIHAPVLWGVVMALMSLIPAIGAPVVWLPFAVYLFATGATWQSVLLAVYGTLVIGSADNILRPIMVGRDTRIPDYLILLATLGGIPARGLHGFVVGPTISPRCS